MATIGSRVFAVGGDDKYLTLANEEYVRPLSIGNSWTRIRIGLLMAMTPDGTNNLLSCNFVYGLCSGTTNPYGATSTTHFIGCGMTASGTLNYTAGTAGASYFVGTSASWVKRVNTTVTTGGSISFLAVTTVNTYAQRRCAQYIDITKYSPGASNYAATQYTESGSGTSHTQYDVNYAAFLYALEQNGTPVLNGVSMNANGTNGPVSDSDGPFDTLDIYWNKASFPWEIYGIAVYRFA